MATEVSDETVTLTLPGHATVAGHAKLEYRPRSTRITRAIVSLLGFWILAPIVALVPPHVPWALGAFLAGIFFGYRNLRGVYVVHAFEGACPRCGTALTVAPGAKIRSPHAMDCFNCHFHPTLEIHA